MARLIIIGGSLGGLFAANLLSRQGHDVVVLEKAVGSLDGRGAGIVTHPALMDALTEVGVAVDQNIGIQVERRVTLDQQGQCIADLGLKQTLTSWSRVYHLLKEQFPKDRYLHAKSVTHIAQQSHEATVTCEDGSSYTADLIIASDGLRSVVRASLAPVSMPVYAGYVAWRGVCDENTLSQHTLNSLFNHFGFCLPPGEQILGYPVAGEHNNLTVGQRRYNFVWYRPAAQGQELNQLLTDADGRYHGLGIAPLKVSWR